jgi:hypothetical protein
MKNHDTAAATLCTNCQNIDPEKGYPSKIAIVYPEGSLLQNIAIYAFNHLSSSIDDNPVLVSELAQEFGVSESEVHAAVETLYTEN